VLAIPCCKTPSTDIEGRALLTSRSAPFLLPTGSRGQEFIDKAKVYYGTWAGPVDAGIFGGDRRHNGIPTVVLVDGRGEPVSFMCRGDVEKGVRGNGLHGVGRVMEYWRGGVGKKGVWDKENEERTNIWTMEEKGEQKKA